jgi:RHS repeat-associated protein
VQHIEYVPFGEVFIEERNNTWNTPYLFNAKELDEETGLYYYGARYYDSRVSNWLSVDALATYNPFEKDNFIDGKHNGGVFNSFNHGIYTYCYQNPIRLIDPNGKQVDIVITNEIVGKTQIRLIAPQDFDYEGNEAPRTVSINLYKMTVTDKATGTVSNYAVTRDAPVYDGTDYDWFSDNETYVKNTAFEPAEPAGKYIGIPLAYPHGTNLEALALRNPDGTAKLKTDAERQLPPNGITGIATGVMIHVGGTYERGDGNTSTTGSFGCFGVDTGNAGITKLMKDIISRQKQNSDKTINISIQKRDNVDWNYVIGSDGEKTSAGL